MPNPNETAVRPTFYTSDASIHSPPIPRLQPLGWLPGLALLLLVGDDRGTMAASTSPQPDRPRHRSVLEDGPRRRPAP